MSSTWTAETITALGATTNVITAGEIFGFGRTRAYRMARTGEWEQAGIRVVQIDGQYRVSVPSILAALGQTTTASGPGTPAAPQSADAPRQLPVTTPATTEGTP
jgi:hypothetical protein